MKIYRYSILLLLLSCSSTVLLTSCTKASFENYHGKDLSKSKSISDLEGTWTDSNQNQWKVEIVDEQIPFKLLQTREGKKNEFKAILTEIEKETIILWVQDNDSKRFMPFRLVQSGSDSFVVLASDADEIKKLIEAGKIKGILKKDHWFLEDKDAKNLLISKSFWSLKACLNFEKSK